MRCWYCERRCELRDGGTGVCGMYTEHNGEVVERFPDQWSSYHASHIEQIPFYHVYPGSRSLVIGSVGCNFNCDYCMNSYVAKEKPENVHLFEIGPEKMVKQAKMSGCHNIVFGVNELAVSLPSVVRIAEEAKKEGIPMGSLTNGYFTEESAELAAEHIQFFNISLKSISPDFYKRYAEVEDMQPVMRNIERLARTNHVEITTPIVQSVNDHEIMDIAKFIQDINPNIPWHVFRLIPEYRMKDCEYPDIREVNEVLKEAREIIPYIYFSNFVGSEWVSTRCPKCGKSVIERVSLGACGGKMLEYSLKDGMCPFCKEDISVLGSYEAWNSREVSA